MLSILILIHAFLGGLALFAGLAAILAKKGRRTHRKSGKLFYYCMLASSIAALVIAVSPGHENPFLFSIGVFTCYFVLSGKRSLRLKKGIPNMYLDRILSLVVLSTGLAMLLVPLIAVGKLNLILVIFGLIAMGFGIRDLIVFKYPQELKKKWKRLHLGNMMAGYISAFSAFLVVNEVFPVQLLNWLSPTVVGTVYIVYWMGKVQNRQLNRNSVNS